MKATVLGGKLPKSVVKKIESLGEEIIKHLEEEKREQESKPMKFSLTWDGKGEFKMTVDGSALGLRSLLTHAIESDPRLLDLFMETLEYVDYALSCDCDNCTSFRTSFEENRKKYEKED